MKFTFNWMQLLRLLVMVVAVAAIIYALEYMPSSPWVWVSIGILFLGFMMMLIAFRIAQRRLQADRKGASRKKGCRR